MGRTQQFLTEVEAAIGRSLPTERRAEVLAETCAHLEDRTEDLAFGGAMSQEKAEEEALSAFGSAKAYAHNIAESFYEDGPRRKIRKFALVSALLCIGAPAFISLADIYDLLSPGAVAWEIVGLTLIITMALSLGMLGRRAQTQRISVAALCLFLAIFLMVGRRDVAGENGKILGRRAQVEQYLFAELEGPDFVAYSRSHRLEPIEEAERAFTSSAPIPAKWKLADGTYPVPPPREKIPIGTTLWRFQGRLSATYSVRSEEEARKRWQADGKQAIRAEYQHLESVKVNRQRILSTYGKALAKPFHPMAALMQLVYHAGLWLLVILCDALGAALGRWVHRKTWNKKPTVPRKGAAA